MNKGKLIENHRSRMNEDIREDSKLSWKEVNRFRKEVFCVKGPGVLENSRRSLETFETRMLEKFILTWNEVISCVKGRCDEV